MDGGFKCVCDSGYRLSPDRKRCIGKEINDFRGSQVLKWAGKENLTWQNVIAELQYWL